MHDSDGLSGFQLFGELTQYPSIRREVSQRHVTCHVTGGGVSSGSKNYLIRDT